MDVLKSYSWFKLSRSYINISRTYESDRIYTTFLVGGQWVNWNSCAVKKEACKIIWHQTFPYHDLPHTLQYTTPNAVRHCLWWSQIAICSTSSSRYDRCPDFDPWHGKSAQNSRTKLILIYRVMITIGSFLGIHASFLPWYSQTICDDNNHQSYRILQT